MHAPSDIQVLSSTGRPKLPPLQRNEYGAIWPHATLNEAQRQQLGGLLEKAVRNGQLKAVYVSRSQRELECLNHDVYDVLLERGRIRAVIVQERGYWKSLRKPRSRITKRYVLLTRAQRSLYAEELDTATCVKRAKNTEALGDLVRHYTGAKLVACKTPRVVAERAYKVLARDADGALRSVFDESVYRVGVWRSERAEADHGGGFYFYWSEHDALAGLAGNTTFAVTWTEGVALVLCEVEVAGRTVEYGHGKHAASRLRVMRELRMLQRPAGAV